MKLTSGYRVLFPPKFHQLDYLPLICTAALDRGFPLYSEWNLDPFTWRLPHSLISHHTALCFTISSVTVKSTWTPPIPLPLQLSTHYRISSKSKTLSKFHQMESPKFHHLNQVWVRLCMQFIQEQNSPPSVDRQNQRTSYLLQQTTTGHGRTPAIDTRAKGEKMEATEEVVGPNQLGNPVRQTPLRTKPGINPAWLLDPPWFHPWDILPFSWKPAWVVLASSPLPSSDFCRTNNTPFILSFLFSPNWQCFYSYKVLKNFVGLPFISWGLIPWDKRLAHRSFLNNPTSSSHFYWDGVRPCSQASRQSSDLSREAVSHTRNLFKETFIGPNTQIFRFLEDNQEKIVQPLPELFLECVFLTINSFILASSAVWMGWEGSKLTSPGSF